MTSEREKSNQSAHQVRPDATEGSEGQGVSNIVENESLVTSAKRFRLKKTIVLVGLMGSGKSSVGRRLAMRLGAEFRDSDSEIELAAGRTIPEIFADFGEPEFRKGETRVLSRLLDFPPHVLATGGGIVIAAENRELIRRCAVSIWLDAGLEVLWKRVMGKSHRPLLQQENPKQVLANLLESRRSFYEDAKIHVKSEDGLSHEDMVDRIIAAIENSPYVDEVFEQ